MNYVHKDFIKEKIMEKIKKNQDLTLYKIMNKLDTYISDDDLKNYT